MKIFQITYDNLHEIARGHDECKNQQMEIEAMTETAARRKFWDHWGTVYRYDVNAIALKKVVLLRELPPSRRKKIPLWTCSLPR